jgi:NADPH-dependent curcumin reductase CurA
MAKINRQVTLASRPVGFPRLSDFQMIESPVPVPTEGAVLVRTIYLSVDPYMRGRMSDVESYARPVAIGDVMIGGAVGKVVESVDPKFRGGDIVEGMLGWGDPRRVRRRRVHPTWAVHLPAECLNGPRGVRGHHAAHPAASL